MITPRVKKNNNNPTTCRKTKCRYTRHMDSNKDTAMNPTHIVTLYSNMGREMYLSTIASEELPRSIYDNETIRFQVQDGGIVRVTPQQVKEI